MLTSVEITPSLVEWWLLGARYGRYSAQQANILIKINFINVKFNHVLQNLPPGRSLSAMFVFNLGYYIISTEFNSTNFSLTFKNKNIFWFQLPSWLEMFNLKHISTKLSNLSGYYDQSSTYFCSHPSSSNFPVGFSARILAASGDKPTTRHAGSPVVVEIMWPLYSWEDWSQSE